MQGQDQDIDRRSVPIAISGGILAGTGFLVVLAAGAGSLLDLSPLASQVTFVSVAVVILVGEYFAMKSGRVHPFSIKRQAKQRLMFQWSSVHRVFFAWGFDAGFGLGVYKVTGAYWLLLLGSILGLFSPLWLMVYALSFTSGLMFLSHRKVRSSEQIPELDTMVLVLVERMKAVQVAALPVTIGAILAVAI